MAMHYRYHVLPIAHHAVWAVDREDMPPWLRLVVPNLRTQEDAVAAAEYIALWHVDQGDTVSLYIHGEDGQIREERTFPRSADPFLPAG